MTDEEKGTLSSDYYTRRRFRCTDYEVDEAKRLYYDEGVAVAEIAAYMGRCVSNIYSILNALPREAIKPEALAKFEKARQRRHAANVDLVEEPDGTLTVHDPHAETEGSRKRVPRPTAKKATAGSAPRRRQRRKTTARRRS